jgi:ectonucleotide pyrophosphatase/phosphodiesterase family member 5
MRKWPLIAIAFAALAFLFVVLAGNNPAPRAVVIIIDGFSSSYLNNTPKLLAIAGEWNANLSSRAVMPSITPASHASMLSGVNPEEHGVISYVKTSIKVPTIFDELRGKVGTCFIASKAYLDFLAEKADLSYEPTIQPGKGISSLDYDSISKASEWAGKCPLIVVNLPETDILGHDYGPGSMQVKKHLAYVDNLVNDFVQKHSGSTIIIVSDHGMCAKQNGGYHGTNESCSMTVPIFTNSKMPISLSSVKDVYSILNSLYQ